MSASELPRPDLRSKEKRKRAKRSLPISEAEWDQAREEVSTNTLLKTVPKQSFANGSAKNTGYSQGLVISLSS